MRDSLKKLLVLTLVALFAVPNISGQDGKPRSADLLRDKIAQLEQTDLSARSQSVKDIYERSLLRLYGELIATVEEDIAALEELRLAVNPGDAKQLAEIVGQQKSLAMEKAALKAKGLRIGQQLAAAANTPAADPTITVRVANQPADAMTGPRSDLVALAREPGTPIALASLNLASERIVTTDSVPPNAAVNRTALVEPLLPQDNCYSDAPEVITSRVDQLVNAVMTASGNADRKVSRYSAGHEDLFFYTVADAVSSSSEAQNTIRALKAYRYLGESARTDKQIGASAQSEGSTSAVEKPGFADLLGWAVEHGAIQKAVNGTTLTLSSSPYAIVAAANGGDTAENYQEYDFLNRVGVSASFNISDQSNVLTSASRKQLTEWSARMRLSGDRSTRSKDFEDFWNRRIRPRVRARLFVLNRAGGLLENDPMLGVEDGNGDTLSERINNDISAGIRTILNGAGADAQKTTEIRSAILCGLKQRVYDQIIQRGDEFISTATRNAVNADLVPALFRAHEDLAQARKLISDFLEEVGQKPLITLAYNNHRTEVGSDYSEFKFLFERNAFRPIKMVANAGLTFYHRPDRTMNQQKVRDIALSLSFEGKAKSPFVSHELDLSNITYSFSGRYQRTMENRNIADRKADIAVAQFKLEIPVLTGFSLPFSVTYANATELNKEDHIRANFGLSFDTSKLLNLRKLSRLLSGAQ